MVITKAGYFIDEINAGVLDIILQEDLDKFYNQNLFFTVLGLPSFLEIENIPPALKVAWNIISRGSPTRASVILTDFLLKEHLNDYYSGFDCGKPELRAGISNKFFSGLDENSVRDIITNFQACSIRSVAADFGSGHLAFFKLLQDLVLSAQIQKTVLLSLCTGSNRANNKYILKGVSKPFASVIIDDINELFSSLNSLLPEGEKKLPMLLAGDAGDFNGVRINVEDDDGDLVIKKCEQTGTDYYHRIFTDRRIEYNLLGSVKEGEIDQKYVQRFEYHSKDAESALRYFLQNIFRKKTFRPGQEAIINRALQGKAVIGLLPTGGGKSLTYQLCALLQPGVTIVVDPINSLMKDQYDKLLESGITNSAFINSFDTKESREAKLEMLAEGKYQILFVSPERFQMEKFRASLSSCKYNKVYYSYAVIDEAHCVSEWGHDFRHTYLRLAQNLKRFCHSKEGDLTIFGLTATASFDVLADVQRELEISEDAIISLPAEAIDRKELNFEIKRIDCTVEEGCSFWKREDYIKVPKYLVMNEFLEQIPQKIKMFKQQEGYLSLQDDFYAERKGTYENAGVIFCPTKSNHLGNGVLAVYDELDKKSFLKIGTFFGGADDDTVKDERIEDEAQKSYQNQVEFIKNRKNLMIATKAFGMGIDKPNIRFSIHYCFPNSVESFYQEAGRAGRDGQPAVCTILYHPKDALTNEDFYKNAFKGVAREKEIMDELLNEVIYEDNFYLQMLQGKIQDKHPVVHKISLWNERYLYIFGPYKTDPEKRISIGTVDLLRGLISYDNAIKNFDEAESKKIINEIREVLKTECPNGKYLEWLKTKSADGINTLIEQDSGKHHSLKIGFTNDTISKLTAAIKGQGNAEIEEVVIRAAYNFSSDGHDFINNLKFQYKKFTGFKEELILNQELENYLTSNYNRIRNAADTQRAIYRLLIAGIIDDYVIDYAGRYIEIRFKGKTEKEYKRHFESYLKRYLGNQRTNEKLVEVDESDGQSILYKVVYTLIAFIEDEISNKRQRSIQYMQTLCELALENQDENAFRDNIVYYFTSKYARVDYLPKDTDGGRLENADIVKKYLGYISEPPDGLGKEVDNAKHLRGACANLRITMTQENASIDLLASYSLFALEAKESDSLVAAQQRPLIKEAIQLYRKGFRRLLQIEDWQKCKELILLFNDKALDINPPIKPLISSLTRELLINRTAFRLNQYLDKVA